MEKEQIEEEITPISTQEISESHVMERIANGECQMCGGEADLTVRAGDEAMSLCDTCADDRGAQ